MNPQCGTLAVLASMWDDNGMHVCRWILYQLWTFLRIFTYKLVTYLSTGDVTSLQNALFCGSCRVSRVCSGIPWSYRARVRVMVSFWLYVASRYDVCMCMCVGWCACACSFLVQDTRYRWIAVVLSSVTWYLLLHSGVNHSASPCSLLGHIENKLFCFVVVC